MKVCNWLNIVHGGLPISRFGLSRRRCSLASERPGFLDEGLRLAAPHHTTTMLRDARAYHLSRNMEWIEAKLPRGGRQAGVGVAPPALDEAGGGGIMDHLLVAADEELLVEDGTVRAHADDL